MTRAAVSGPEFREGSVSFLFWASMPSHDTWDKNKHVTTSNRLLARSVVMFPSTTFLLGSYWPQGSGVLSCNYCIVVTAGLLDWVLV